jgi:hypothetical protein
MDSPRWLEFIVVSRGIANGARRKEPGNLRNQKLETAVQEMAN